MWKPFWNLSQGGDWSFGRPSFSSSLNRRGVSSGGRHGSCSMAPKRQSCMLCKGNILQFMHFPKSSKVLLFLLFESIFLNPHISAHVGFQVLCACFLAKIGH